MKYKDINQLIKILANLLLLAVFSCKSDPYLYDRTGFEEDGRPIVAPNPNAINTANPNYYPQPNFNQPVNQQNFNRPPVYQNYQAAPYPNYQQPNYPQPNYQPQPSYPAQYGGSRYYSDPYAIPPSQYYPRYDSDQYYSPPNYYYNVEQPKFKVRSTNSGAF